MNKMSEMRTDTQRGELEYRFACCAYRMLGAVYHVGGVADRRDVETMDSLKALFDRRGWPYSHLWKIAEDEWCRA